MNSPCLISVTAKMPIRISPSISLQHPSLLFPSNQNNSSKWPNATCNTKAESFVGKTQGHIYRRVKLLYKCSTLPNSSRKYTKKLLYKQAGMHKKKGVYVCAKRVTIFAVHCWGGSYGWCSVTSCPWRWHQSPFLGWFHTCRSLSHLVLSSPTTSPHMSCHQSLQCNLQTKLQLAIQVAKWSPKEQQHTKWVCKENHTELKLFYPMLD